MEFWCGIDPDTLNHVTLLLDLHPMPARHDADAMCELLLSTARRYQLDPMRLVSVVGDGAAAQQAAMRKFCTQFAGHDVSLHCASHLLQLCFRHPLRIDPSVPPFVRAVRKLIDFAADVSHFFSVSPGAAMLLKLRVEQYNASLKEDERLGDAQAEAAKLMCWALIKLMMTRWDAVYRMLKRLILLQKPVESALRHLAGGDTKSTADRARQLQNRMKALFARERGQVWMAELVRLMEKHHQLTQHSQGGGWVCAAMYYPLIMSLTQGKLDGDIASPCIKQYSEQIRLDAQRRVQQDRVRELFGPQLCSMYLYYRTIPALQQLGASTDMLQHAESLLMQKATKLLPPEATHVSESDADVIEIDPADGTAVQPPAKRQKVRPSTADDMLDAFLPAPASPDESPSDTPLALEFVKYRSLAELALADSTASKDEHPAMSLPALFWHQHRHALPWLFLLALHFFGQTISSAESERVFSVAGTLVTPRRTRMSQRLLSALLMIAKNRDATTAVLCDTLSKLKVPGSEKLRAGVNLALQKLRPGTDASDLHFEDCLAEEEDPLPAPFSDSDINVDASVPGACGPGRKDSAEEQDEEEVVKLFADVDEEAVSEQGQIGGDDERPAYELLY